MNARDPRDWRTPRAPQPNQRKPVRWHRNRLPSTSPRKDLIDSALVIALLAVASAVVYGLSAWGLI